MKQAQIGERFRDYPILEGVVTTTNSDGSTNVSPMGPRVDWPTTELLLRPYPESTTYANLVANSRGVFHVTDDVLLMARAAIGRLDGPPPLVSGPPGYPQRLAHSARWYAFEVESIDEGRIPVEIACRVRQEGKAGELLGLNRAKHAVLEAAILATRLRFLPIDSVLDDYARLATIVEKTAAQAERTAFAELQQFVTEQLGEADTEGPHGR